MTARVDQLQITHECRNCGAHHPAHRVLTDHCGVLACPLCSGQEIVELEDASSSALPRFHAESGFQDSVFAYAHHRGVDVHDLDTTVLAVQRLLKHSSTVVTKRQAEAFTDMKGLGYIDLIPTEQDTYLIELKAPSGMLSSYFWSVWIPHYLQSRGYQVSVMPHLQPAAQVQHCTVVFRIPGPKESSRQFLSDLANKFTDMSEAEIIHLQAGNAFEKNARVSKPAKNWEGQ